MSLPHRSPPRPDGLARTLNLPLLVFYGVGVTVGAGIFALIGEILAVSGNQAPFAFLVAGVVAGLTGVSYMQLVRRFPRAGGEAVYVTSGLGPRLGRVTGFGVVATGTISSAVVALAFGGYLSSITTIPPAVGALSILAVVLVIASAAVKQSVLAAAGVTVIEVGALIVVAVRGLPTLADGDLVEIVFTADGGGFGAPILNGAVVAFFAFIGFEDIANMAEETVDPRSTAPRAIAWTLVLSLLVYVMLAAIAVAAPGRQAIIDSDAPMAALFEAVGGGRADMLATVASIAMTNGILVQVMMSSRVLYGMAREELLPAGLSSVGDVDAERRTPRRATLGVGLAVATLIVLVPLGRLARLTSLVILCVFTLVNFSLFRIGTREHAEFGQWRWLGLGAGTLSLLLAVWETTNYLSPG